MERSITIRFSHIDAAAIVFYPRYFELLAELFDELPFAEAPFAMQADFLRPNCLGDEVCIGYEGSRLKSLLPAPNRAGAGWSFTGRMNGEKYFSIQSLPFEEEPLASSAHRPDLPAFTSSIIPIAPWTTDCTGQLQVSRYFELVNLAVEQWFAQSLGMPFGELHNDRGDGIPTVRMRTQCRLLPRAGESVTLWIRPTAIGSKSFTYTSWLVRDGDCLMQNDQTIVWVNSRDGHFHSVPIPQSVRKQLQEQYVAA